MYTGGPGNYPRPPKKNNGVMVALIAIAVLLVIVVALLVVYLVKDDKPAQQETQNTEVVETKTVNVDTTTTEPAVTPKPKAPEPPEMAKEREMRRPLEGNYSMSGSVGKYGVVMQLNIDGNYISGKYRYTRMKGAGGWLTISGERSGGETQGELYISEYNDMGENCGNWSGTYHLSGNKLSISGSMVNFKGTTYRFNLSGK